MPRHQPEDPIIPFRVSHAVAIQRAQWFAFGALTLVGGGMLMKVLGVG